MACLYDESVYPATYEGKGIYIGSAPETNSCVVFSYDRKANQFNRSSYSPDLTEGRANFQQLDAFLGEVEKILKKKIGPIRKMLGLFTFFAIFGLTLFVFLLLSTMSDEFEYTYENDTTVPIDDEFDEATSLFIGLIGYMFVIMICGGILEYYNRKRYQKARKAVKSFIDRSNPIFAAQGLRWNMPQDFPRWIELWKDYKVQAQCMCNQMLQPQNNTLIYYPEQIMQQQPYVQRNPQQVQEQYQPQPMPYTFSNKSVYPNNFSYQHLQNQKPSQENSHYIPPQVNNYSSSDN